MISPLAMRMEWEPSARDVRKSTASRLDCRTKLRTRANLPADSSRASPLDPFASDWPESAAWKRYREDPSIVRFAKAVVIFAVCPGRE